MYLSNNKVNKCCLGSAEVKKIYQGSNLVWQNRDTAIFGMNLDGKGTITAVPNYLDVSLLINDSSGKFDYDVFNNGFRYYSGSYGSSYSGYMFVPLGTTSTLTYYRTSQLIFNFTGKYRITLYNSGVSTGIALSIHGGEKITTREQIKSATNRVYHNDRGYLTESFEIDVKSVPYYLNFSSGRLTTTSSVSCIFNLKVEPI